MNFDQKNLDFLGFRNFLIFRFSLYYDRILTHLL